MKPHVIVAYPLNDAFMEELGNLYTLHRFDRDGAGVLEEAGQVCTAMLTSGHVTIDAELLAQLPNLRLMSCASAGYDQMDLAEMTRRGITLTNTSDALVDEVANTAVMLGLAAQRRLIEADGYLRRGDWGRDGDFPLTRSSVARRCGIVGLGNIGQAIAKRFEALSHEIGYFGRNQKPVAYRFFDDLRELADWADFLIVATPGGPETIGLISAEVIEALGPEGVLVNIARGSVVDEPALIAALQDGRLGAAGLDVFLDEPHPDPALAELPNTALFPHHASGTIDTRDRMARLALDNLAAFFEGKPLLTPVN